MQTFTSWASANMLFIFLDILDPVSAELGLATQCLQFDIQELAALHRQLEQETSRFADTAPGWAAAAAAVASAAAGSGALGAQSTPDAAAVAQVSTSLEAAISNLLLWAQSARAPTQPAAGEQSWQAQKAVSQTQSSKECAGQNIY